MVNLKKSSYVHILYSYFPSTEPEALQKSMQHNSKLGGNLNLSTAAKPQHHTDDGLFYSYLFFLCLWSVSELRNWEGLMNLDKR